MNTISKSENRNTWLSQGFSFIFSDTWNNDNELLEMFGPIVRGSFSFKFNSDFKVNKSQSFAVTSCRNLYLLENRSGAISYFITMWTQHNLEMIQHPEKLNLSPAIDGNKSTAAAHCKEAAQCLLASRVQRIGFNSVTHWP